MNLNKAFVLGRLTNDPDSRVLPSGSPVTNFSVATNRIWNNKEGEKQEETQFHNIVVFGRLADIASRYLAKGRMVLVEGRIQTRSWEGSDGNKRYRTEIIAENIQLGPRSANDPASERSSDKSDEDKKSESSKDDNIPVIDQDEEVDTSDIPF